MAIPLYVPEEYGPSTPSRTWSQPQQPSSLSSSSTSAPSCASFVHQLIIELCSIYRESCAATTASADGLDSEPAYDVNNNSVLELIQRPQRRRRHPAGATETTCSNRGMIPLLALMPSDDLHSDRQQAHSEFECKLSVETNFGSIGAQLRQIADSYTVKTTHHKNLSADPRKVGQKTSSGQSKSDGTSWSIRFTFFGSLLFLGTSLTATVVLVKNK